MTAADGCLQADSAPPFALLRGTIGQVTTHALDGYARPVRRREGAPCPQHTSRRVWLARQHLVPPPSAQDAWTHSCLSKNSSHCSLLYQLLPQLHLSPRTRPARSSSDAAALAEGRGERERADRARRRTLGAATCKRAAQRAGAGVDEPAGAARALSESRASAAAIAAARPTGSPCSCVAPAVAEGAPYN